MPYLGVLGSPHRSNMQVSCLPDIIIYEILWNNLFCFSLPITVRPSENWLNKWLLIQELCIFIIISITYPFCTSVTLHLFFFSQCKDIIRALPSPQFCVLMKNEEWQLRSWIFCIWKKFALHGPLISTT